MYQILLFKFITLNWMMIWWDSHKICGTKLRYKETTIVSKTELYVSKSCIESPPSDRYNQNISHRAFYHFMQHVFHIPCIYFITKHWKIIGCFCQMEFYMLWTIHTICHARVMQTFCLLFFFWGGGTWEENLITLECIWLENIWAAISAFCETHSRTHTCSDSTAMFWYSNRYLYKSLWFHQW